MPGILTSGDFSNSEILSQVLATRNRYPTIDLLFDLALFYLPGGGGDTSSGACVPTSRDAIAGNVLSQMSAAGIILSWYLPTANNNHHPDLSVPPTVSEIENAIVAVKTYYPEVTHINFDEVGQGRIGTDLNTFYAAITNYAHSQGFSIHINIPPGYESWVNSNPGGAYPYDIITCEIETLASGSCDGSGGSQYSGTDPSICTADGGNWVGGGPPNYTDSLSNTWHIPTPADVSTEFGLGTPVAKRGMILYLSATWFSSPYLDLAFLTDAFVQSFESVQTWFEMGVQGATPENIINTIASALTGISFIADLASKKYGASNPGSNHAVSNPGHNHNVGGL